MTPLEVGLSSMRFIDPTLPTYSKEIDLLLEVIERGRANIGDELSLRRRLVTTDRYKSVEATDECAALYAACIRLGIKMQPVVMIRVARRKIVGSSSTRTMKRVARRAVLMGPSGLTYDACSTITEMSNGEDAGNCYFDSFIGEPGEEIELLWTELELGQQLRVAQNGGTKIAQAFIEAAAQIFDELPVIGSVH